MRAAEFMRALADIIDKLDGPSSNDTLPAKNPEEKDENPIMIPPLQQNIELAKAEKGKDSEVIRRLTQPETDNNNPEPEGVGAPETVIPQRR